MTGIGSKLKTLLFGKPRNIREKSIFHQLSLVAFFAWVGLGTDGLSSSCYGPSEAFRALAEYPHLAIFVAAGTALTVFVICASYSQIIDLFPTGGGGYVVASKLLSPAAGMLSGCLLLVDYVLTISVSITSGTEALLSFAPQWHDWKLPAAAMGIVMLTILNLRGVRESIVPMVPIFLVFLLTHAFAIVYSIAAKGDQLPQFVSSTADAVSNTSASLGVMGMIIVILRAYSMGAGTFTGIEAVSNGMSMLREPRVQTAKSTMRYMAWSLAFMATGMMVAYMLYPLQGYDPRKTLNAALFSVMTADWNSYLSGGFVFLAMISEGAILYVAAQTGFLGGPRVAANMAQDRWLPNRLALLSDRLVTSNGVAVMGLAALAVLLVSRGSLEVQITLYSICVFTTFVLSQLSMVRHWWQARATGPWKKALAINGLGLTLSVFILITIVVLRFDKGGWVAAVIIAAMVLLAVLIRRHYKQVGKLLAHLNTLAKGCEVRALQQAAREKNSPPPAFDPKGKTAVLLVGGFNGIGLHSLLNLIRFFGDTFRNFIFVEVGVIDAGNFKGVEEIERLRQHTEQELDKYVHFCRADGYYAEAYASIGVDLVEEITTIAQKILQKYPDALFFGGQLVFPHDSVFSRWLHNATVFAVQRRFYSQGFPFMVLPIRVNAKLSGATATS